MVRHGSKLLRDQDGARGCAAGKRAINETMSETDFAQNCGPLPTAQISVFFAVMATFTSPPPLQHQHR